jgi:hypothetical protein
VHVCKTMCLHLISILFAMLAFSCNDRIPEIISLKEVRVILVHSLVYGQLAPLLLDLW